MLLAIKIIFACKDSGSGKDEGGRNEAIKATFSFPPTERERERERYRESQLTNTILFEMCCWDEK